MGEIILPKTGDAMTEGKVVQWYKSEGDQVKKGEPVVEIETDKVNLDVEAEEDGTLSAINVGAGEIAEVGAVIGVIGNGSGGSMAKKARQQPESDEEEASPEKKKPEEEKATEETPEKAAKKKAKSGKRSSRKPAKSEKEEPSAKERKTEPAKSDGRRVRSSPLARRVAAELGVDISEIEGSGPGGRVVASDVHAFESPGESKGRVADRISAPVQLESKSVPLTAMRRTIASRLVESIGPIPHFFLTIEVDATELLSARKQLNEIQPVKTSVNDFVVRAAALAILHHPEVNASFTEEAIEYHASVDVGIAVATDAGLLTPVVTGAHERSIPSIAESVRDLASRAKNKKLRPDEYQGSTFTISNLGMFGIQEFTAIINPPNVAILAVGAAEKKPVVVDDQVVVRDRMKITMSCDHRVIDGAAGARYLETLRTYLEQPLRLFLGGGES